MLRRSRTCRFRKSGVSVDLGVGIISFIKRMTNKGGRNSLIKVSRQNSKRPEPTADIWSLITRETICVTCESRSRREGEKLRSAGRHFPPVIWRGDRRRIRGEQLAFVLLNYRWHARALQVCGGSANGICMMPIMNNDSIDLMIKEMVFQVIEFISMLQHQVDIFVNPRRNFTYDHA